jgi:hypothetical protein
MNGYVTPQRLARTFELPISMAQTELRRGEVIQIAQAMIAQGQTLEMRTLTLNLVRILTFGQIPVYLNSAFGLCSVGLYFGPMISSPLAYVKITTNGTAMLNPYKRKVMKSPGIYTVLIANNTNNIDLSVCATGSMKFYQ